MKLLKIISLGIVFLLISTVPTHARSTTYIGNYEVTTEDNGIKKEVVRVAGSMGKVVKSRVTAPQPHRRESMGVCLLHNRCTGKHQTRTI